MKFVAFSLTLGGEFPDKELRSPVSLFDSSHATKALIQRLNVFVALLSGVASEKFEGATYLVGKSDLLVTVPTANKLSIDPQIGQVNSKQSEVRRLI